MYPQFRFQVFRESRTWQKLKASKGMNKTSTKLRKYNDGVTVISRAFALPSRHM